MLDVNEPSEDQVAQEEEQKLPADFVEWETVRFHHPQSDGF